MMGSWKERTTACQSHRIGKDSRRVNLRSKGVVQDMCADGLLVCLGEALEIKHGHAF
jgi:hypothetical protein